LIFEIWLNLIQNAIKFSDEQTVISIGLHNTGQFLRFDVTNTGPYIDAHDQGRIFERFYKGDKAHSKEGNGLGLAIVKTILETMDGRIFLESHEDRHTTFTVEFKRAPDSE
jgi:signal transduction histidine kinase